MSTPGDRLILGRAAILSISHAASLLPLRDAEARAAIRKAKISRWLSGREVVVWGDVIDEVLSPLTRPPAGPRGGGR